MKIWTPFEITDAYQGWRMEESRQFYDAVDVDARIAELEKALSLILGWREIDRNTLGERLTAIGEIASTALGKSEGT